MNTDLDDAKIIRVTMTVDYLVDTDKVTQFETWLTDFPLHQSHAARDWWRLGNSERYVSHQVLSVHEAYETER